MRSSKTLYVAFGYKGDELTLIDIAGFDQERTKLRAAAFFGYDNYVDAYEDDLCIVLAYEPTIATDRAIENAEKVAREKMNATQPAAECS